MWWSVLVACGGAPPREAPPEPILPAVPAPAPAERTGPVLTFIPGSTRKVEQLIGDLDRQTGKPTLSRTESRYDIVGTDLGYPFEHDGKVCFLFGDTIGPLLGDTIACTDAKRGDQGVKLDFLTDAKGRYLRIRPDGEGMGGFEVPVSGINLADGVYVVVKTKDGGVDTSTLTRFDEGQRTFTKLREVSRLPDGRFVQMSMRKQPERIRGLPEGGPWVLVWGTGEHRASRAYLAVVPARSIATGEGTRYLTGVGPAGKPRWGEREADAVPIVDDPTIGDLSVTWVEDLDVWLMVYDQRDPRGVVVRTAPAPWGPWSAEQHVFDLHDGEGKFIHDPDGHDQLAGPTIGGGKTDPEAEHGGAYAPFVIERFTRVEGDRLDLYFVLSTWNPYVVVLMNAAFDVRR